MYCLKCGKELDDNAKFCNRCGTLIEEESFSDPPKIFVMIITRRYMMIFCLHIRSGICHWLRLKGQGDRFCDLFINELRNLSLLTLIRKMIIIDDFLTEIR